MDIDPTVPSSSRLHTASGAHSLHIGVADSFWRRLRGLMFAAPLAPDHGLLLTRCDSVHCAFMRQVIDVVYLDEQGTVLRCVEQLKPWRASVSQAGRDAGGRRNRRASHTLELAAGTVARLRVAPGDRLEHPVLTLRTSAAAAPKRALAQRGIAMVEFVVVGPALTLAGLAILQYGMIFFAKNHVNHASFMAARAGAMGNASISTMKSEYAKALVPLHGGASNPAEFQAKVAEIEGSFVANNLVKIELLNPTKESFDNWNDPALQAKYNTGERRVIPNAHQALKDHEVKATSGQTIQDANLIKLRVIHGYLPKVPIARSVFLAYMRAADPGDNPIYSELLRGGYIPVVTNVTMHMQSDAIEGDNPVSTPGTGNNGTPTNPGDPPTNPNPPPNCTGIGCNNEPLPTDPGTPCTGSDCPICPAG